MNRESTNGHEASTSGPGPLNSEEAEQLRDMLWAMRDPDIQAKYPDEVVAVYQRQVVAHGDDGQAVLAEAQRITGLPKHRIPITTIIGPKIILAPRD